MQNTQNTLLTYQQQLDLVSKCLAKVHVNGTLSTFKYARKVMYDYLWDKHPECKECRGHVYDNTTGELVQAAPRKSFQYLENGTWENMPLDAVVYLFKKFNGFMACATKHKGQLIVSTTGSTSSQYVEWAKPLIENHWSCEHFIDEYATMLYEVVIPEDPHIVDDPQGVIMLGWRYKDDGFWVPNTDTHKYKVMQLGDALEFVNTDFGEGYMMYSQGPDGDIDTMNVCKLKTPYYSSKKKLMRQTAKGTDEMYADPVAYCKKYLDKKWLDVVASVVTYNSLNRWKSMDAQSRRKYLENYWKEIHD